MSRRSPFVIGLNDEDRDRLEALARRRTAEQRMVLRTRIVLAAADGGWRRRSRLAPGGAPFAGPAAFAGLVIGLLGAGVVVLSLAVSVSVGAVTVPIGTVWASVGNHLGLRGATVEAVEEQIVWDLRLEPQTRAPRG